MHGGMQADLNACERLRLRDSSAVPQPASFEASAPAGLAAFALPTASRASEAALDPLEQPDAAEGAAHDSARQEAAHTFADKEPSQRLGMEVDAEVEAPQQESLCMVAATEQCCGADVVGRDVIATGPQQDGMGYAEHASEPGMIAEHAGTADAQLEAERSAAEHDEPGALVCAAGTYSATTLASGADLGVPKQPSTEQHVSETPDQEQQLPACTLHSSREDADMPSVHLLLQLETQYPDFQDHHALHSDLQERQPPAECQYEHGGNASRPSTAQASKPAAEQAHDGGICADDASPQAAAAEMAAGTTAGARVENAIWNEILASPEPSGDHTPAPRPQSWQLGAARQEQLGGAVTGGGQRATGTNGLHLRPVWGSGTASRTGASHLGGSARRETTQPSRGMSDVQAPALAGGLLDSPETPSQIQATADVLLMYSRGLPGAAASPGSHSTSGGIGATEQQCGATEQQCDAADGGGAEVQSARSDAAVPDTYPNLDRPGAAGPSEAMRAESGPEAEASKRRPERSGRGEVGVRVADRPQSGRQATR